jgi:hypothetical protein
MSKVLLPWCAAMLCVAVALFGWGCDGDDDDSTTVVVTNAPAADDDDEAGPETLDDGTVAVPDGGIPVDAATVTAPGDGTIIAVVTWAEAVEVSAWFVKGADPSELGKATGDSPLTSTVGGVTEGEELTLRMIDMEADPAVASFTITFEPE